MKRKNFTHILISALIIAVLFALLTPVYAFALDSEDSSVSTDIQNEAETDEATVENSNTLPEAGTDSENFFGTLFSAVEDNISQILSALAFLGSLIIILCYKKGLLPLITEGLGALASGVKAVNEKTNELDFGAEELSQKVDERLKSAENLLCNMERMITELDENLKELENTKNEPEKTNTILSAEVDMLYEIFMSAALPQYLKDSVGERIAEMKANLSKEASDEES